MTHLPPDTCANAVSSHVTRGLAFLSASLVLALVLTPAARAASGSDLGTGYTWIDSADGAEAETATFDSGTMTIAPVNNAAPTYVTLPWNFTFYGTSYPGFWLSDNGWISFIDPMMNAFPGGADIPVPADPNAHIAIYWTQQDASDIFSGHLITHGEIASVGAYMVQQVGREVGSGLTIGWSLIIYQSGEIEFQYNRSGMTFLIASVGIENADGTDGAKIAGARAQAPGVPEDVPLGYVIEFLPPAILLPQCGDIPAAACPGMTAESLPGGLTEFVSTYGCDLNTYDARERVYALTVTQTSQITADVVPGTVVNPAAFLLGSCNERDCLQGGGISVSAVVTPGTYYLVVDAPTMADEGTFDLNIACTPVASPIACGDAINADTNTGTMLLSDYDCPGAGDLTGPELFYDLNIPAQTNAHVTMSGFTAFLDVMLLDGATGELAFEDCLYRGDDAFIAWNIQPGDYVIAVDGFGGDAGTFDLSVDCRVDMDCVGAAGPLDFDLAAIQNHSGDTNAGLNRVQQYSCDPDTVYDGREEVIELVIPRPGSIAVTQTSGDTPMSYMILSSCNEGDCVSVDTGFGCAADLEAGTYYLVVDSPAGDEDAYSVSIAFEQPLGHWTDCELPSGATQATDTQLTLWEFNDGAYCYTEPGSINFPDGCSFAMYVTVQCGTAMHVPLFDVEGGHIRIFDVFNDEYIELTAQSPSWAASGTEIQWQDPDCTMGTDPRWNEVVTDVSFERPDGLCGVFRLEFLNHSGFEWELFANCDGTRTPRFDISDSICGALALYDPLPSVSLIPVSEIYDCPDVEITYDIRNDGCVAVNDFVVRLTDDGVLIAEDIITELRAGETVRRVLNASFPMQPTGTVLLTADPDDLILECDEAGGGSACEVLDGNDILNYIGCTGICTIDVLPTATPSAICSDAGTPVVLDACGTAFQLCDELEYAYLELGAGGMPVFGPECSWVLDPPPVADTNYSLIARCVTDPDCSDFEVVTVEVDQRPDFDPASVQARDRTNCNLGVLVTWDAATFHGPGGTGAYNVYRSPTDCMTDLEIVVLGLTELEYIDIPPAADTPYYYVVEAEDDADTTACLPPGPRNGGSTSRGAANGGTCTAILDSVSPAIDLLPRMGESLRVGGTDPGSGASRYSETFVQLFWTPDRDADPTADEHFHIYRSAAPDSGFVAVTTDAPFLQVNEFLDPVADQPNDDQTYVWFYLGFSSDACESENVNFDRFCTDC